MKMKNKAKFEKLLPWYINRTLDEDEAAKMRAFLASPDADPQKIADIRQIFDIVRQQPLLHPSKRTKAVLLEKIHAQPQHSRRTAIFGLNDAVGLAALWLSIFLMLWVVFQPGIVIHWSLPRQVKAKRISLYRSDDKQTGFRIINQIGPVVTPRELTLKDPITIPGKNYYYRIEIVDNYGQVLYRELQDQTATVAMASYLLIFILSILLATGIRTAISKLQGKMLRSTLLLA